MSRSTSERLADIQNAISKCFQYSSSLDNLDGHIAEMAMDAIERNIAVIGEAVAHLPEQLTNELTEVDWAAIRGMRNVIVHEYFRVNPTVVYDVIQDKLQTLSVAIEKFQKVD